MLSRIIRIWPRRACRRIPPALGLALGIFALTVSPDLLRADPPLKFADPEVTAYVQALTDFRDHYVAATRAARRGDDREMKRLDAEFPALEARAARLVDKLRPSETKLFTEYVSQCGQTIMDAAFGLTPLNGH